MKKRYYVILIVLIELILSAIGADKVLERKLKKAHDSEQRLSNFLAVINGTISSSCELYKTYENNIKDAFLKYNPNNTAATPASLAPDPKLEIYTPVP